MNITYLFIMMLLVGHFIQSYLHYIQCIHFISLESNIWPWRC